MPDWVHDTAFYDFRMTFEPYSTSIWVQGAKDLSEENRPQLILEDHKNNKGQSLDNDDARNNAISKLSSEMNINPSHADWYVRDSKGNLQSLEISEREKFVENPQFTRLRNNDDLNASELKDAKKAFPDIKVWEVESDFAELTPDHDIKLGDAFQGREYDSQNNPVLDIKSGQPLNKQEPGQDNPGPEKETVQPLNEQEPGQMQAENAQDIDLSRETFRPQEMERGR